MRWTLVELAEQAMEIPSPRRLCKESAPLHLCNRARYALFVAVEEVEKTRALKLERVTPCAPPQASATPTQGLEHDPRSRPISCMACYLGGAILSGISQVQLKVSVVADDDVLVASLDEMKSSLLAMREQ